MLFGHAAAKRGSASVLARRASRATPVAYSLHVLASAKTLRLPNLRL